MSYPEYRKTSAQIVARAWQDEDFKARLMKDPAGVFAEHNIAVPEGKAIRILEDTDDVHHVVLPSKPTDMPSHDDLSDPDKAGPMLTCFFG